MKSTPTHPHTSTVDISSLYSCMALGVCAPLTGSDWQASLLNITHEQLQDIYSGRLRTLIGTCVTYAAVGPSGSEKQKRRAEKTGWKRKWAMRKSPPFKKEKKKQEEGVTGRDYELCGRAAADRSLWVNEMISVLKGTRTASYWGWSSICFLFTKF